MRKIMSVSILLLTIARNSFAQNVGIGTTIPAEKLHVAGNIKGDTVKPNVLKITPNAGAGKILTSDDAGNANWLNNNAAAAGNIGFGVWGDCATNGNITEYNPVADANGNGNDFFGISVSISGNYAIIGANRDDVGFFIDQGSASIYQYNGSTWVLMQKLTDATGAANDSYGLGVSISGNYAVVGAPQDDILANTNQGSASIYQYNGSSWVLMQKLTDATGLANDNFGRSVSISGNYVIVGASLDDLAANTDQGSASIYQYNGVSWVLMQKITDATGDASDYFGFSVSISGTYSIVGAYASDGVIATAGSASIYQYNGSNWVLMQKLTDPAGAGGDWFGISVSISGNYAIVGAEFDDVGANISQGSASIYQYTGASWVLMQKITDGIYTSGDHFGTSVFISGNYAIIGSSPDDVGTNSDQGSSSIYLRVGTGWQKLQYVTDPGGNEFDHLGSANAIDGSTKRFIIAATGFATNTGKVVLGKVN